MIVRYSINFREQGGKEYDPFLELVGAQLHTAREDLRLSLNLRGVLGSGALKRTKIWVQHLCKQGSRLFGMTWGTHACVAVATIRLPIGKRAATKP